jgi:hypothetical protein
MHMNLLIFLSRPGGGFMTDPSYLGRVDHAVAESCTGVFYDYRVGDMEWMAAAVCQWRAETDPFIQSLPRDV